MNSAEHWRLTDEYLAGRASAELLFDTYPEEEFDHEAGFFTDAEKQLIRDIKRVRQAHEDFMSPEEEAACIEFLREGTKASQELQLQSQILTEARHLELTQKVERGNAAKQRIFEDNLSFIAHFVRSSMGFYKSTPENPHPKVKPIKAKFLGSLDTLAGGNLGFGERYTIAAEAFWKAIDKFQAYERKSNIRTFASWCMENELARAIGQEGFTIRIPDNLRVDIATVSKHTDRIDKAKCLGWPVKEIVKLERAECLQQTLSIDVVGEYIAQKNNSDSDGESEDAIELVDLLVDSGADWTVSDEGTDWLEGKALDEALASLSEREQLVLERRFADGFTLREIGEQLGLTHEGVRQVELKALKKLRGDVYTNEKLISLLDSREDAQFGLRDVLHLTLDDDVALGINRVTPYNLSEGSAVSSSKRKAYTIAEFDKMRGNITT